MAFFRRTYLLNQLAISIAKLYTGAVRSRKLSDAAVFTKYRRQRNWSARLGLWQFRARFGEACFALRNECFLDIVMQRR